MTEFLIGLALFLLVLAFMGWIADRIDESERADARRRNR